MSTLFLQVKSGLTQANLKQKHVFESGKTREQAIELATYFRKLAAGGAVVLDIATSANDPVAAAGTFTLTYASIANSDTVTIGQTTLTCVTGTPTTAQFKKEVDLATTATNFAAAINAHATLSLYMSAVALAGVVTVTMLQKGGFGNLVKFATSNGAGFALVQPTGGAGGAEEAATTYALGG